MPKIDPGPVREGARRAKPAPSRFQQRLSLLLMTLLVLIGGAMVWIQNHYDPADWNAQSLAPEIPSRAKADLPEGLAPLSPPEQYQAENLSDKINGKADLYLSAGFKSLESHRFALVSDNNRWMERYLYDMGGHQNAFAVYSVQRRRDTQDIDLTPHAYLSANGLFLVHGPYYLEIIAAEATPRMQSQMKALASAFIAAHPVEDENLPLLERFAPDNKIPHTTRLIADSAFGIQNLDWVYTAMYAAEDAQATVFISQRESPSQARTLADKSIAYWSEYGGETIQAPEGFPEVRIVFILDNYEIVAVQGRYLYGVHEATDLDFGLALISRMGQTMGGTE